MSKVTASNIMFNIYIAEQRRTLEDGITVVPDYPGLTRWRWIAQAPWWYFESEVEITDAKLAPKTYPNGVPVWDKRLIAQMEDHAEVVKRVAKAVAAETIRASALGDDELIAEVQRRNLADRIALLSREVRRG